MSRTPLKPLQVFWLSASVHGEPKVKTSQKAVTYSKEQSKKKQESNMISPIYWGEFIEVHHAVARGAVGDEFGITNTPNNTETFSGLNLELMGTSETKQNDP